MIISQAFLSRYLTNHFLDSVKMGGVSEVVRAMSNDFIRYINSYARTYHDLNSADTKHIHLACDLVCQPTSNDLTVDFYAWQVKAYINNCDETRIGISKLINLMIEFGFISTVTVLDFDHQITGTFDDGYGAIDIQVTGSSDATASMQKQWLMDAVAKGIYVKYTYNSTEIVNPPGLGIF